MAEPGAVIDHATQNLWVVRFSPLTAANAQARKGRQPHLGGWTRHISNIKVQSKWAYLYRTVNRDKKPLYFIRPKRRNTAAARRFFKHAVDTNGVRDRIAIDQSGANLAALKSLNAILKFRGAGQVIGIVQPKYFNNIFGQG